MTHKNVVTWNCMISGYVRNQRIRDAREVFDAMPIKNVVSWTAMLSGYAKCGKLEEARSLFDAIHDRNVVCWNSMISGYTRNGRISEARELFDEMPVKNSVSWAIIIEGCFCHGFVSEAEKLFDQAPVRSVTLYNTMLAGYVDMGYFEDSHELFMRMPQRDVASWTSMITCFSRARQMESARGLFEEMPEKDVVAWTAIIRGYLHNNQIEEARKLFNEMPHRDIVAWNSIIGGYVQNGRLEDALELFMKMPQRDTVSWNSILQGYVQQDDIINARTFFDQMPRKDETTWNTMISGYQCEEALVLYTQMLQTGFKPDQGTFTSVISICGMLAVNGWGRAMHLRVIKVGFEDDVIVISSLISMYSKCGSVDDATLVFERMITRDTIAWNAMIVAQTYHGSAVEALKLFPSMIQAGFEPDHMTFLGLLTACAHSGLVDEGWKYFKSMEKHWNLIPKPEHFSCMVDLLGRSGLLAEAYELVKQLPVDLPAYTWEALLSSCRVHENFELGEVVAEKLLRFQPTNVGMYVLLSNIYAARGMWKDAEYIRAILKHHRLKKELACSWIEMNGQIFQFVCNDKSHPQTEDIYKRLVGLSVIIEESWADESASGLFMEMPGKDVVAWNLGCNNSGISA
ncbi:hypothetical protein F0562_018634 [Nyssa sinensis]|uniref:Pentatricopeptide repeat-containing protein n=1 Tax=Nyssa sinensis TaxID=561372 RepID=A0A5J4ZAX0_9ASTE|nr:hypothetical protein F0562_018634 [Nyssa sinensis]